MKRLSLVIITQEDSFFLPDVINNIILLDHVLIQKIVILNSKGSLENRKFFLIKLFGFCSVFRLIFKYLYCKFLNIIDSFCGYKLLASKKSILGLAKTKHIPCLKTEDVNSDAFLNDLSNDKPDLILSFSAPQPFKESLLHLPRFGVLNVHSSLLPYYRGIMPSFWVLANGEKSTGVTVHRMAKKIDEGDILLQREVDITNCKTVFEVIGRTKIVGGKLAQEVLRMYSENPDKITFKKNNVSEGKYYSWPSKEDVKRFHKRGYRFA